MMTQRKRYSADFKFQVALKAAKGLQTINELASQHGVHPNQIGQWKQEFLRDGPAIFANASVQDSARKRRARPSCRADWRAEVEEQLSNTLAGLFCRVALRQALQQGTPGIFNTDQGAQFTAVEFTALLETAGRGSAWMAGAVLWTTCLSSGSGGRRRI